MKTCMLHALLQLARPCLMTCVCFHCAHKIMIVRLASQVLEFPEDIFEEAALVSESLRQTSNGAAGSLHLAPDSYISSGLVAHAVTQLAAGHGTIKLSQVKVCKCEGSF